MFYLFIQGLKTKVITFKCYLSIFEPMENKLDLFIKT